MTTRVLPDSDEQQIADLIKAVRRLQARVTTTQVRGYHDEETAAATPATTYPLTYIPVDGTCQLSLNGLVLIEGTDYTCDYDTGLVTVTATQVAGDHLTFRYLITDYLVAASLPPETDAPVIGPLGWTTIPGEGTTVPSGGGTYTNGYAVTADNLILMCVTTLSDHYPTITVSDDHSLTWTQAVINQLASVSDGYYMQQIVFAAVMDTTGTVNISLTSDGFCALMGPLTEVAGVTASPLGTDGSASLVYPVGSLPAAGSVLSLDCAASGTPASGSAMFSFLAKMYGVTSTPPAAAEVDGRFTSEQVLQDFNDPLNMVVESALNSSGAGDADWSPQVDPNAGGGTPLLLGAVIVEIA